jgi:hypothetical protein
MSRRIAILVVAGAIVAAGAAPTSLAIFHRTRSTTADLATGRILPPTGLAASIGGSTVTLTWTPTTSSGATRYDVLRSGTSGSGYAVIGTVSPISVTTTTDGPGIGAWYYVLRSVLSGWTSGLSNEALAALGGATGFVPCTSNAPVTTGSGNNDGYETNPGNGCVADGSLALDSGSGTNANLSCTDAGKDRHQFWGYAFALPAAVTSVDGIEVSLDAGLNNQGGTSMLCVQLSWDGGTTWTSAQQTTMGGAAVATYAFGSATDTWGRTWTLAELGPTKFRIRITDVTSHPNKEFRLDGATVQVDYTP